VARIAEDNPVGLDFLIVAQQVQSQRAGVELQAARAYSVSYGVWQPYARLRWLHEFGDDPRRVLAFFRGGHNVFRLGFETGGPDRDFGEVSLGVIGVFPHGWQAYAGWQHTAANSQLDEDQFQLGWRREF
jgi:outer membrane autotransporter protein